MNLNQNIGPLPLGLWIVVGVGGIGVGFLLTRKSDSKTPPGTTINYTPMPAVAGQAPAPPPALEEPPLRTVPLPKGRGDDMPIGGQRKPTPLPTPKPVAPVPPPKAPTPTPPRSYPGLPAGFVMDCATTYRGLLFPDAQTAYAHFVANGVPEAQAKRNVVTVAATGGTSPWAYFYSAINPLAYARINQTRIAYGLYPLTAEELQALSNHMYTLNPRRDERAANWNDLSYAAELWARWDRPYQCGQHTGGRQ